MNKSLLAIKLVAASQSSADVVTAESGDCLSGDTLTGDWNGNRTRLEEGYRFFAYYNSIVASNVSGGVQTGSDIAGALSMYFGAELHAPHGDIFVLAIPNVVSHLGLYAVAFPVGTLITAAALLILKTSLEEPKPVAHLAQSTK
jgi:hypothetical protein